MQTHLVANRGRNLWFQKKSKTSLLESYPAADVIYHLSKHSSEDFMVSIKSYLMQHNIKFAIYCPIQREINNKKHYMFGIGSLMSDKSLLCKPTGDAMAQQHVFMLSIFEKSMKLNLSIFFIL